MTVSKFNFFAIFILAFLFAENSVWANSDPEYRLKLSDKRPEAGTLSLNTRSFGTFMIVNPRDNPSNQGHNYPNVFCRIGNSLKAVSYNADTVCESIEWKIGFSPIKNANYDVSEQKNVYLDGMWWSFSEWNSLVRIKGFNIKTLCIEKMKGYDEKCTSVPSEREAPLIVFFGKTFKVLAIGFSKMNIYSNIDSSEYPLDQAVNVMKHQLVYLSKLSISSDLKKSIDIGWIAVDENQNELGGAAGKSAYMANFKKTDMLGGEELEKLLWISGHELFHMLVDKKLPLWMSESLAHYYGFKSLRKSGFNLKSSPDAYWLKNKKNYSDPDIPIYGVHEKVTKEQDYSYYGLFYDKGAAFWYELDSALEREGRSLDDFLADINADDESFKLNRNFNEKMEKVLRASVYDGILKKF